MRANAIAAAVALATAAVLSSCDGIVTPPPVETVTVRILSPTNGQQIEQTGWPETPVQIRVEARSSLRGIIAKPTVRLDGNVIGQTSSFTDSVSNGSHVLEACANGVENSSVRSCDTVNFTIAPALPIVIEITRGFLTGPPVCDPFYAYARRNSVADTAQFVNCRAGISPRLRLLPDQGRIELIVDERNSAARTYYGSIASVRRDSLVFAQKFALVPLRYTIPSGRWVGQQVAIDLENEAFAPGDLLGFALYQSNMVGETRRYDLGTWPATKIPVPWALDREDSEQPISANDSTKIAVRLERFNTEVGRIFFRPAEIVEARNSGIRIVFDSKLGSRCIEDWTNPDIMTGKVSFLRSQTLDDEEVPGHEFMHCLGFGHAKYPDSFMGASRNPNSPLYGSLRPKDVAYLLIRYDIQELRRQTGAQYGLPHAHQWHRVILLGLPLETIR